MAARHARWLFGAVLGLVSCRSILDIHEGQLDPAAGASAGTGNGAGTSAATANGGSVGQGDAGDGSVLPLGGKAGMTGMTGGKGGVGQGGTVPAEAGAPIAEAGSDAGGAGNTPTELFPAGVCRACMDRNCSALGQACADDAACAAGVPDWLSCTADDANACVTAGAGSLQALETCGAGACDVCRHLDDGKPTVEILTPANGAAITLDDTGLVEVAIRVHNFTVTTLGNCGANASCGHVHLNLDGASCKITPFYNNVVFAVDNNGVADTTISTLANAGCQAAIKGKTVLLSASLSAAQAHQDRVPLVQSAVDISISE